MAIMKHTRYLALVLALTMAAGGCHHAQGRERHWSDRERDDDSSDDTDLEFVLVLLSVVVGIALIVAIVDALVHPEGRSEAPSQERLLETVRGQVVDVEGRPIAGARLEVRAAKRYTAQPEKLGAITLQSGPDGRFVLPMLKANVLCVDITAEGKPPVRRWIVALADDAMHGLPADLRDITFVSPHVREADMARVIMADR